MNSRAWAFAIYSILYEIIIWGFFGYAVFARGMSQYWIIVAVILSASQLKPKDFGINSRNEVKSVVETEVEVRRD